jgi:2-polyprenyl-3-methyl-5-hydroxy-6-metoxy-1,4-benzoquinol methylase
MQDFEKWNDEMSRKYNIDTYRERSHWFIRWVEGRRQKFIVKYLSVQPGDKVIDLGCGAGHLLAALPKAELFGVDFSDFSLSLAEKRLAGRATLLKGDVTSLPLEATSQKFDKIACTEVIEHVPVPEKLIAEILKIAQPKATIVISVPNEGVIDFLKNIMVKLGLFKLFFPNIPVRNTDEWHLHVFDHKKFETLVAGKLRIVKTKSVPWGILPIRYIFVCKVNAN